MEKIVVGVSTCLGILVLIVDMNLKLKMTEKQDEKGLDKKSKGCGECMRSTAGICPYHMSKAKNHSLVTKKDIEQINKSLKEIYNSQQEKNSKEFLNKIQPAGTFNLSEKILMINKSALSDMHAGYITRVCLEKDVKEAIRKLKEKLMWRDNFQLQANVHEEIDKIFGSLSE